MTLEQFAEQVQGKVWRKNDLVRIYFKTDKSASAYLDYDEDLGSDFIKGNEGAALRVFSKNFNCDTKWNVNRAKQIKHDIMTRIAEITGDKVCEDWRDVIL